LCRGLPHHNCTAARLSIIVSAFIAHLLYYLQAHCANKDFKIIFVIITEKTICFDKQTKIKKVQKSLKK
ncbi:hypothetical protein, partial [Massilimicrobiota sp. An80]|uniref:hypothetical protein n=1 Tax=Massilimicrobiota sp. An80 TaxID=1965658 RepID=UPI000B583C9B